MADLPPALWKQVLRFAGDCITIVEAPAKPEASPRFVYVNPAFERASGYTLAELQGQLVDVVYGKSDPSEAVHDLQRRLHAGETVHTELLFTHRDGARYWVEVTSFAIRSSSARRPYWVSIQRDITQRKHDTEQIRLLTATLEHASDAIMIGRFLSDTGEASHICFVNHAFSQIIGYSSREVLEQPAMLLFGAQTDAETLALVRADLDGHGITRADIQIQRANGSPLWVDLHCRLLAVEGDYRYYVTIFRDITHRKDREKRLREENDEIAFSAVHDSLTGLHNRRAFEERTAESLASARRDASDHVVAVVDLDGFKQINEICGHAGGDFALRQIADTLKGHVRQNDMVARIGGDEFALLLENCSLRDGLRSLETLLKKVRSTPIVIRQARFNISLSIGVSVLTAATHTIGDAIALADASCYSAKRAGGDRIAAETMTSEVS